MYKIDLHTHSIASRDGAISAKQYAAAIETRLLDYIAITDHNKVEFALELKKSLGEHIIVGEEINTFEGEIIGLFLKERVARDLSAQDTANAIHDQGGLVYVPHPFETVRKGISKTTLEAIINDVDIIEVYNGRAVFQNMGPQSLAAARLNQKPGAASSDAHGAKGLGSAYSEITKVPRASNLVTLLHEARLETRRPPLHTLLYPKLNRIRKGWPRD